MTELTTCTKQSPFLHIEEYSTKNRTLNSIKKSLLANEKMRVYRIEGAAMAAQLTDVCSMGEFRAGLLQSLAAMAYFSNHIANSSEHAKAFTTRLGCDQSRSTIRFDDLYSNLDEPYCLVFVHFLQEAHCRNGVLGLDRLGDFSSMRSSTLALSQFSTGLSGRMVCNLSPKGAEVFRTGLGATLVEFERTFGRNLGPARMLHNSLGESTNLVCAAH